MFFIAITLLILLIVLRLTYTCLNYFVHRQFYLELSVDGEYCFEDLIKEPRRDYLNEIRDGVPILVILGVSALALYALNNGIIGQLLWHN